MTLTFFRRLCMKRNGMNFDNEEASETAINEKQVCNLMAVAGDPLQ